MPMFAPKAPDPLPAWFVPWVIWRIQGKSGKRPLAPERIPDWALWYPEWVMWRRRWGNVPGAPPKPATSPTFVPKWAFPTLKIIQEKLKPKPPPPPPPDPDPPPPPPPEDHERELAFFRRMTVWVTRPDHMPVEWLVEYSQAQYPLVVIPTLFGTTWQRYDEIQFTPENLTAYINQLHSHGFKVCGSQWGTAVDPVAEAEAALGALEILPLDGWVMNGEKPYEGGGRSRLYVERFRATRPRFPLAWTPEQRISIDHGYLQLKGVFYMPQCYPLESGGPMSYVMEWARNFGYDPKNVGPLCQAYQTNGVRADADTTFRDPARAAGAGALTLYTGNQCLDDPGFWRELVL